MPINKEVRAKATSGSTHGESGTTSIKVEQGDVEITNHMSADTLIEPEDDKPGSTHTSITAKAAGTKTAAARIKANSAEDAEMEDGPDAGDDEDNDGLDDDMEDDVTASFGVGDEEVAVGEGDTSGDDVTNNNQATELSADADDLSGDDDAGLDDLGGDDTGTGDVGADGSGDDLDWDSPPSDDDMGDGSDIIDDSIAIGDAGEGSDIEAADIDDDLDAADTGIGAIDESAVGGESLPLVDVDETPDDDVQNVAFASFGTNLMVIRANRIIATMNKRVAASVDKADVYLSDQFQEVVASEMGKKGLRAGLAKMGFVMARVNVSKSAVINARVQKETQKVTAGVRKVQASKEAAFTQSVAIAAVGINRQFFKDTPNELKASLEAELTAAGVRSPHKLLSRVFAAHGPAYAKSIIELATKISAMPQDSRDGYVAALDMTNDNAEPMDDSELADDIGAEGVDMSGGDDVDFIDDMDDSSEVSASLASPGFANRRTPLTATVSHKATGYSVQAHAVLSGERPLFGG